MRDPRTPGSAPSENRVRRLLSDLAAVLSTALVVGLVAGAICWICAKGAVGPDDVEHAGFYFRIGFMLFGGGTLAVMLFGMFGKDL